MSGVGEALAIVSCVAGLIQALDSGSRIVRQIKQRRQAHGALPPSDILEETIENGKKQIEQVVAKGSARFGSDFVAGDDTAELALSRITIQIQNALLQRLTLARTDDGVIDFDECIDLSDQGCNDALVALQALYQRKLRADIDRKKSEAKQRQEDGTSAQQQVQAASEEQTQPPSTPALTMSACEPFQSISRSETAPVPQPNERRKRGLGSMFHSKSKQEPNQQLPSPASSPPPRDIAPPGPTRLRRTSTTSSQSSSLPVKSKPMNRSNTESQQTSPAQSSNDQISALVYNWSPNMSRASTLASISSNAAIANFGGCCKYSHLIREKGPKAGVGMINTAMYSECFIYQCKSTKCSFGKEAVKTKKGWEIDDTVRISNGIQYRWLFLAKSHVQIPNDSTIRLKPYKCLLCLVLNHHSETYLGVDELFSHIARHQESRIGEVKLEGPLAFSNQGAVIDAHFDIKLPRLATPTEQDQPIHGTPEVVAEAEILKKKLDDFALGRTSKSSSIVSYDTTTTSSAATDPSFNPWAFHG